VEATGTPERRRLAGTKSGTAIGDAIAKIETAQRLEALPATEERDRTCVVPTCDVATGLEIDHWRTDFAATGSTAMDNLARLCHYHDAMKTHRGFVLGGGPGR
jgi:hypothetical protein